MNQNSSWGFTLIEVVLAIAVGLIIIAGVSVGYTYAKRAAILDNQRKNVAAIRTFVEQAITSQQAAAASGSGSLVPLRITGAQLVALAERLPSLKFDPYTGTPRQVCNPPTRNSCYEGIWGPYSADISFGGTDGKATNDWPKGAGSMVQYAPGDSFKRKFTLTLADGTVRTFYGYVVMETDADGYYVAADGGDITTSQIGQ